MKKITAIIIAIAICASFCACGESKESVSSGNNSAAKALFSKVAGNYSFLSGAGGWSTDIELNDDGTFTGTYHDTDIVNGEEYAEQIAYSRFSGKFKKIKKLDKYIYSAELEPLNYETETGREEIVENATGDEPYKQKHVCTTAYGLEKCETVYFYLKGSPMSDLPEEFISWGYGTVGITGDETKLPVNGFYNVEEQYGFFEME